jgi:hypothetical protein
MSDGANIYNKLIGYVLWINRKNVEAPQRIYVIKGTLMGSKKYKVTLRNVKLYIEELKKEDPTITSVTIDKLSSCGVYRWNEDDSTQD